MIFITTIPHHGAPQCKSQPDTSERSAPAHGCCQLPSATRDRINVGDILGNTKSLSRAGVIL